jgi:very-short-patch-repair endonuclease
MNEKYNPNLKQYSRTLRKNMTDEENHLWHYFLKDLPVTIHRQKIIGNYIVDFYCASAKLVIELDGSQHYEERGINDDAKRDEYLRNCGLTVKRYTNADVNKKFDDVCRDIYAFIFGAQMS